jgi:Saxitoxin biosynthesis operon protein SxtJ
MQVPDTAPDRGSRFLTGTRLESQWFVFFLKSASASSKSMSLIRINQEPSRRHLAVFAIGWTLSLAFIGWLFPLPLGDVSLRDICWVLAVVVPAIGLAVPGFLKATYLASAYAALPIGLVVSYVILGVIYYLVLTPVGLLLRLRGYDPLNRRFEHEPDTYWRERETSVGTDRYFRQF